MIFIVFTDWHFENKLRTVNNLIQEYPLTGPRIDYGIFRKWI